MMSPEQLRLATEGNLNPRPLAPEDLQFKIISPIDQPIGIQRFFSRFGNNLKEYGVPVILAVISGLSAASGYDKFNQIATSEVVKPVFAGLAYAATTFYLSKRVLTRI